MLKSRRDFMWFVVLLLALWGTRLAALTLFPLHNDEGLHLTRAVEVWNGHPFWDISDGKIVNHWLIAPFYPQHTPVFAGRVATVFMAMVGLAAGLALARRLAGNAGAVLTGVLWIASPYLFFFERLALSDAEAGAFVVVTAWLSLRLSRDGTVLTAVLTGLALASAALLKLTAAPFALTVLCVVALHGSVGWWVRFRNLVVVALTVVACFLTPLVYSLVRGGGLFDVALMWLGEGSSGQPKPPGANAFRLLDQLLNFGVPLWALVMVVGLVLLTLLGRRRGWVLVLALIAPTVIITTAGSTVLPRHFVVALPLAVTLGGAGVALALRRVAQGGAQRGLVGALCVVLFAVMLPFALTAYTEPPSLALPDAVREQYVIEHSAGYGLREAVLDFPSVLPDGDLQIVASMFPASCRRANFYTADETMQCVDAPGLPQIEAALACDGAVVVLVDTPPLIGLDVASMENVEATLLGSYPRPGETVNDAAVRLWLLEVGEDQVAAGRCSAS